tara:strand:- start:1388 stop:1747 length:360 start_codon:yes stop_codon:yes gene_type:complete
MKQKKIKNMTINEVNSYTMECLQSLQTQHELLEYWKEQDKGIETMFQLTDAKRNQLYKQKLITLKAISDLQDVLIKIQKHQDKFIQTYKSQAESFDEAKFDDSAFHCLDVSGKSTKTSD